MCLAKRPKQISQAPPKAVLPPAQPNVLAKVDKGQPSTKKKGQKRGQTRKGLVINRAESPAGINTGGRGGTYT